VSDSHFFEVLATDGSTRRARLRLSHGAVETPVFMPVGTYGAVKAMAPTELAALGTQILLGNTYHLYLRPGLDTLTAFSGLHRFMSWDRPILTDSGGFQVFSLGALKELTDEGVVFRSHLDGDLVKLTPEVAAHAQQVIGSDIAMVLDECIALPAEDAAVARAVRRSAAWARRFLDVPRREGQRVFGIVQGGTSTAWRKESLGLTLELPIDGVAIGGLSVGEPLEAMLGVLEGLAPDLPKDRPRYLMGVGTPRDLLEAVRRGIDMFDCVLPTRNGRNGSVFTNEGTINLRNALHRDADLPVQVGCECPCCREFSRGYLRHLFQTKEILGCRLATSHNLHYYHRLMSDIRESLDRGEFEAYYRRKQPILAAAYPDRPLIGDQE